MEDRVVISVCKELVQHGLGVCRFNFRGRGCTASSDRRDTLSLCKWLLDRGDVGGCTLHVSSIILVGYSYGALVAGSVADELAAIVGVATISYPYSVSWALALWNANGMWEALRQSRKPKLWCVGTNDDFTGIGQSEKAFGALCEPKEEARFEGADHFYGGRQVGVLARRVAAWASGLA